MKKVMPQSPLMERLEKIDMDTCKNAVLAATFLLSASTACVFAMQSEKNRTSLETAQLQLTELKSKTSAKANDLLDQAARKKLEDKASRLSSRKETAVRENEQQDLTAQEPEEELSSVQEEAQENVQPEIVPASDPTPEPAPVQVWIQQEEQPSAVWQTAGAQTPPIVDPAMPEQNGYEVYEEVEYYTDSYLQTQKDPAPDLLTRPEVDPDYVKGSLTYNNPEAREFMMAQVALMKQAGMSVGEVTSALKEEGYTRYDLHNIPFNYFAD